MDFQLIKVPKHSDYRGYLAEFLTRKELKGSQRFGHIYYVTFVRPGIVRGNHYHTKKEEHFGVAMGRVQIDIEDIHTKERKSFVLDANNHDFTRLQIGPNIAHAVKSLSENVVLIDYFSSPYNPKHPDSFPYILFAWPK